MRLTKLLTAIFFGAFLILIQVGNSHAALVTIGEQGDVVWNVLALESERQSNSVQIVSLPPEINISAGSLVSLIRENGKIEVKVLSNEGEKTADVTSYQEEIIEVEQKEASKKLKIIAENDQFVLLQAKISAQTTYPISIDSKYKKLSVQTPSGIHYIEVFPQEVIENLTNADIIDKPLDQGRIILNEGSAGELLYLVKGEKKVGIFNLFEIMAPIELQVSATSGKVLSIEKPRWLKIFGFLLA